MNTFIAFEIFEIMKFLNVFENINSDFQLNGIFIHQLVDDSKEFLLAMLPDQ